MSLQFILGSSGAGKSHYLFEHIIDESIKNPDQNYIILVPEQFTMQTQKELVARHPRKGILNIDILSFERLSYRVFEEVGVNTRNMLEEIGKSFVLQKIALEKEANLPFLGRNLKKPGYIYEMKSLISELAQYDIQMDDLDDMIDSAKNRPQLQGKLKDIRTVYAAFKEYLEDRYMTEEEVLDVLCDLSDQSELLKNSILAFDGYTGFTPIQNKLIRRLVKLSPKIYITVTMGEGEDPYAEGKEQELFAMSKKMFTSLYKMAAEERVEILPELWVKAGGKSRFGKTRALAFLEKNIFRYKRAVYEKEQEEIHILSAKNPLREVQLVASRIRRLVREEGYRYGDIVIITGDLTSYGNYVRQVFSTTEIPYFMDEKRSVFSNPYVEFLRSALAVELEQYSASAVFRYLRSGMSDIPSDEVDRLENYVLALGIRGYKKWNEKWIRHYRGMKAEEAEVIDQIRAKVMAELSEFHDAVRKKEDGRLTVRQLTEAVYELGMARNVQLKLKEREEYFAGNMGKPSLQVGRMQSGEEMVNPELTDGADDTIVNPELTGGADNTRDVEKRDDSTQTFGNKNGNSVRPDLAKEYAQIYGKVMSFLDKLVDVLGEEEISFSEYQKILEAGFQEIRIGIIPPSMDQVLVGDMERTRLKGVKVLFFLGVNEGLIPKSSSSGGILSEADREHLEKEAFVLKPSARENMYIQKFYLYLNLTKPSERLYLSYSNSNSAGEVIGPAYLIGTIRKLFPSLLVEEEPNELKDKIETPDASLEYLIEGLRLSAQVEPSDAWKELYRWYMEHQEYGSMLYSLVEATHKMKPADTIGRTVAKALYGTELSNSATRLERFAACAFAHFLQYGIGIRERQQYEFTGMDLGNIVHTALDLFSKKVSAYHYDWHTLTEDMRERLIDESLREIIHDYGNTILHSSARNEYMINRVQRIMSRTVWALQKQVKRSDFVPKRFEVSFQMNEDLKSVNFDLEHGEKMRLKGRIDRLDTYEEEDKIYVKVIDYKSGSTAFDLVGVYYGLQLQLVLYMNAALELMGKSGKDVQPAGIFYYNVKDPVEEWKEGEGEEDLQERILKDLKVNGLIQDSEKIIGHLDRKFADGQMESSIVPIKYNKNGSLAAASSVASLENINRLSVHVHNTMAGIGRKILAGDVSINPYERKNRTGCDYCPYAGICGFDHKIPGYEYRRLDQLSAKDVWRKLGEEAAEDGNEVDSGPAKGH